MYCQTNVLDFIKANYYIFALFLKGRIYLATSISKHQNAPF